MFVSEFIIACFFSFVNTAILFFLQKRKICGNRQEKGERDETDSRTAKSGHRKNGKGKSFEGTNLIKFQKNGRRLRQKEKNSERQKENEKANPRKRNRRYQNRLFRLFLSIFSGKIAGAINTPQHFQGFSGTFCHAESGIFRRADMKERLLTQEQGDVVQLTAAAGQH